MKIAIVGGGLAGISAAHALLGGSPEVEVHLFEASARYGGRACTDNASIRGFAFDVGAGSIRDAAVNPLTEIARWLGFETIEERGRNVLRLRDGDGWRDELETPPDVKQVLDDIAASYRQARLKPNVAATPRRPCESHASRFGQAMSPYGPFAEAAETWQYIAADRAREACGDAGPRLLVERGVGTLVAAYGAQLECLFGERYVAHLDTPVTDIAYDQDGARIGFGGGRLDADACIVTVPVSVLRDGGIRFAPALPEGHQQACRTLRLGAHKKLALRLRTAADTIEPGTTYWLVHDAEEPGEPAGVWQYYRLEHTPDVLVAQAAGDFARALDAMPDHDVYTLFKNDVMQAHEGVLFTSGRAISNWSAVPGVQGSSSYSAFEGGAPDDRRALDARRVLAQPVETLHFAGEATSVDYYGTLQAACFEGRRAAVELLALALTRAAMH